ncbi:MAG: hypothetical protein SFW36_08530, partial [Leptolyngbyaceae cyanobacterium bins.59]|nr:hypothetical protein [Leptolyngbyaceae cyanobacterium bins.59]
MLPLCSYPEAPDLGNEDYLVLGLATCFVKEEGELQQVEVIEPIPSAALEAIVLGIPTSYRMACAVTLAEALPNGVPTVPSSLPAAHLCDEFSQRVFAATRTYKRRPSAQELIPLGTHRE